MPRGPSYEPTKPRDDKKRDQELSVALNETLVALATEGITDAEQLRNGALQRMPLMTP